MLLTLHYRTVTHDVQSLQKRYDATLQTLSLTLQGIESAERIFPFSVVHDVSYKPFSDGSGFLYIHSNEGVFSFHIVDDPHSFLTTYRKITKTFPTA